MLAGLDILLARMKTNPEEFLVEGRAPHDGEIFGGKWSDLIDYAWRIGTEDERGAIQEARKEFLRDDFNERVFKRLAGEEKQGTLKPEAVLTYKASGRYATGHSDPRGGLFGAGVGNGSILNTNTMTIGSQTLEEWEQQQIYAQIRQQAMKEEMAQRQYDAMQQSVNPLGVSVGKGGFFGKFGW